MCRYWRRHRRQLSSLPPGKTGLERFGDDRYRALPNPGGSTGHASNFIFPTEHVKIMTEITSDSMAQFKELGVFRECGGMEVARSDERMEELKRRVASSKSWGVEAEIEYPIVRDMCSLMYERQAGRNIEVGSYAHKPIIHRPDDIPTIEASKLSPTELPFTLDDFEPQLEAAIDLLPEMLGGDDTEIQYAAEREADNNAATLRTLTVNDHKSKNGQLHYMLGREPILSAEGKGIIDRKGRHSYVTSAGNGPSIGKYILMSYLPPEYAEVGKEPKVEYFGEQYPVTVDIVGPAPLFDPQNERMT